MGKIVKYNISKEEGSSRVVSASTTVSGGYPTNSGPVKEEQSANLWGNDFHGYEDLNGSMLINGDVNIVWDEDDYDDSDYDEEEGDELPTGSLYVSGKVEAKSTYGKTVYLDYPKLDDKKTNLLDILLAHEGDISTNATNIATNSSNIKKLEDAKIWGQGIKSNNYNIIGNMKDVGDINFSGTSKVIGSMSNSSLRPNSLYSNNSLIICPFNGNPWERATNIKNIGAATFISNTNIQLNSVIDYYSDGKYFNNPRVNWYIYNPTSLVQEGHWWLGPTWTNDDTTRFGYDAVGAHKNLSLYPSFEVPDDMKNEDGNPKKEYFEQFEFSVGAKIKSHAFIKQNGTDKQFLMADGSTKELKDLGVATPDEIPDVPTKVSQLQNDVPYAEYDKNDPVILFSGVIHANNNDGSMTYQPFVVRPNLYSQHRSVKEITLNYLEVNGEKKPTLVIDVLPKDGYTVKATSIHTTVSLNQHCNPTTDFGGNRRSQGYWTTGGVFPSDGKIYIQAWRTHDDNNDSTVNDVIAWSVIEMNITIFGLGYKN